MKGKICLGLVLLSLFLDKVNAQERKDRFNNIYVVAEFGAADRYDEFTQMGISMQMLKNYMRIRVGTASDNISEVRQAMLDQFPDCKNCDKSRSITDVSIIYGKSYAFFKHHQIQFGSGLSFIKAKEPDIVFNSTKSPDQFDEFKKRNTMGIPLEIRYQLHFGNSFAFSGSVLANANTINSYTALSGGITFSFFDNKLR